jgi:hypothetical protein
MKTNRRHNNSPSETINKKLLIVLTLQMYEKKIDSPER